MDKAMVIAIHFDDEKVNGECDDIRVILGISEERHKELYERCERDIEKSVSMGDGDKNFNAFKWFIKMLNEEKLSGNELLYYIYQGYCTSLNMQYAAATFDINPPF